MKVIEPSYEIIKYDGGSEEQVLKHLEACGRTCYKSDHKIRQGSAETFVKGLMKAGHEAMIEHASIATGMSTKNYEFLRDYRLFNGTTKHMSDPDIGKDNVLSFKKDWYAKTALNFMNFSYHDNIGFLVSGNFRAWRNLLHGFKLAPDLLSTFVRFFPVMFSDFDIPKGNSGNREVVGIMSGLDKMLPAVKLLHKYVSVRFICNRGFCYSEDTKVLTNEGWKFFPELKGNEMILTKDDNNNIVEEPIKEIVIEDWNTDLLSFKNTEMDLRVTPNHNMWVLDAESGGYNYEKGKFIKAKDMTNSKYKIDRGGNWKGQIVDRINLPDEIEFVSSFNKKKCKGFSVSPEPFLELLGLWVTDGTIYPPKNGRGRRVSIRQTKPIAHRRIIELLDKLNFKYSTHKNDIRINCIPLWRFLMDEFMLPISGIKSYFLTLPVWLRNLDSNLLQCFIKGVLLGDGFEDKSRKLVYSSSLTFCENLVELALKTGRSASIREYRPKGHKRYWSDGRISIRQASYVVNIGKEPYGVLTKHSEVAKIGEPEAYLGLVCCVELEKHHRLYVMRNGKACWSGNTHELVRMRPCSFAQESTRYVDYSDESDRGKGEMKAVKPEWFTQEDRLETWMIAMEQAEIKYQELRKLGASPGEARGVLPIDVKTEIVITTNLAEWYHIFKLRTANAAHQSMRQLMRPVCEEFKDDEPEIFEDITW